MHTQAKSVLGLKATYNFMPSPSGAGPTRTINKKILYLNKISFFQKNKKLSNYKQLGQGHTERAGPTSEIINQIIEILPHFPLLMNKNSFCLNK
jgi:hypothetical protein